MVKRLKENSNELYDLISRCQKNENDAFEIMILKFQPLLKKYAFLLNYGDAYSEMYENFVECVYRIPLYQLHEPKNDSVILAYIKTAMKNSYIGLSKNNGQYKKQIPLEEMDLLKKRDSHYQQDYENDLFEYELKKILCEKELFMLKAKFIYGYSESEIAKQLEISRQAVNKQFQKIYSKIRKYYHNEEN